MTPIEILMLALGLMTSIVSFFLKKTMDDLKEIKTVAFDTKSKVSLIEVDYLNKHHNITEKFDMLNQTMKDLTLEIKALRDKIH